MNYIAGYKVIVSRYKVNEYSLQNNREYNVIQSTEEYKNIEYKRI